MTDASAGGPVEADGTESEMLRLAAQGDEFAFGRLYTAVQPRLRRYAASLVGDQADDVTAEAWLQIARDIRRFRGDLDGFRAWAARIVRNRAVDLMRSRARRPVSQTPVEDLFDLADTVDTEHLALERLSTDDAVALIAALPQEQAEAVMLRAVVGMDAASAGKVLGKSAAAVRVSAHRGLKTLRAMLATDPRPPARGRARETESDPSALEG